MAKDDFERRPSDPIGRQFGPYRPIRRLGVGGMAETYEAIRIGRGGFTQRVCLKLVLPFFRDSEDFIELFEREARLAAKLRHSNIVGVIDFGELEGTPYMALELVDGADLEVLLGAQSHRRLSHEYVALIGHHVAAALNHAHNPPSASSPGRELTAIIHRDISPSNVLISRHGEILLSDFGVAKAVSGTVRKQSAVKGKVPYMSPEQLRAEPLDGRADLFGLGVVLFETLSGQRPYIRENDPATILAILNGEHPSLETLAPEAPPGLCKLIESLVVPDRDQRPANAAALVEALDEFVPSPKAQRELGALVAKVRPEMPIPTAASGIAFEGTEASRSGVRDETGVTAADAAGAGQSGVTERQGNGAPSEPSAPSRRRWLLVLAAVVLLGAGVSAGTFLRNPATAPGGEEASTATEDEAPGSATPPAVEPPSLEAAPEPAAVEASAVAEAPKAEESSPEPAPKAVKPARLSVVVYPWGNVWINGKPRGLSPLNGVTLAPGRYKVSVGQNGPEKSQVVRLRAGQKRSVKFDLTE
ncbi:MAG: protein kinase [Myxococcota bacterium]